MSFKTSRNGFTVVEMLVVIVILGILVSLSAFAFRGWQQSLTQRQSQSDLRLAATAMENAKNFGNGYPSELPNNYEGSEGVTLAYIGGNATSYCIQATSVKFPSVIYHVDSALGKDPRSGSCNSAYVIAAPSPSTSGVTNTGITVTWGAVTGATNYTVRFGPSTPNSTAGCTSSPCVLSGLSHSTNYRITVTSNGTYGSATSSVINATTTTPPSMIASGANFTCAVLTGVPYCAGRGEDGQLGNGTTPPNTSPSTTKVPVTTNGALSGLTLNKLEAGWYHMCAIASNQNAYCWGDNTNGKLGTGSLTDSNVPIAVSTSGALSGKTIKDIAAGSSNTCVIASDDLPYCWGYNFMGQLGNGNNTDSSLPVAVNMSGVLAGRTAKSIAVGGDYACLIASDDRPYCWGYGVSGRLGNGGTANSNVPVAVTSAGVLSGRVATQIALSTAGVSCVVASGNAFCWGDNVSGSMGNGTSGGGSTTPVAVTTSGVLSGKTILDINIGTQSACVIASDNKPYCWGSGSNGRLGTGDENGATVPVAVVANGALNGKIATSISNGTGTPCVLTTVNEVYCWSHNNWGTYGNGTTAPSFVPIRAWN